MNGEQERRVMRNRLFTETVARSLSRVSALLSGSGKTHEQRNHGNLNHDKSEAIIPSYYFRGPAPEIHCRRQ